MPAPHDQYQHIIDLIKQAEKEEPILTKEETTCSRKMS